MRELGIPEYINIRDSNKAPPIGIMLQSCKNKPTSQPIAVDMPTILLALCYLGKMALGQLLFTAFTRSLSLGAVSLRYTTPSPCCALRRLRTFPVSRIKDCLHQTEHLNAFRHVALVPVNHSYSPTSYSEEDADRLVTNIICQQSSSYPARRGLEKSALLPTRWFAGLARLRMRFLSLW